MSDQPQHPDVVAAARPIAQQLEADILLYTGGIGPKYDDILIRLIRDGQQRANILLVLTTFGGSPDSAYRIARQLQHQYRAGKFYLLIDTFCKSAGALIAVGADELIMTDTAELGPLDVQVLDKEEIGEYSSGLTSMQALTMLQEESARFFLHHFNNLHDPQIGFSTKLAAEIAAKHVTGLFSAIYSQLDPYRLGENQRAMHIGIAYGKRLSRANNISEETLMKLVAGYPSHAFVIDRAEAAQMFPCVRASTDQECHLLGVLEKTGKFKGSKIEWIFCEPLPVKNVDKGDGNGLGTGQVSEGTKSDNGTPAESGSGGTTPPPVAGAPNGNAASPPASAANLQASRRIK